MYNCLIYSQHKNTVENVREFCINNNFVLIRTDNIVEFMNCIMFYNPECIVIDYEHSNEKFVIEHLLTTAERNFAHSIVICNDDHLKLDSTYHICEIDQLINTLNLYKVDIVMQKTRILTEEQLNNYRERVCAYLAEVGVNRKNKGFKYLTELVMLVLISDDKNLNFSRDFMPKVASKYATTVLAINHCIRTAIGNINEHSPEIEAYTPKEFCLYVANQIRSQESRGYKKG